MIPTVSQHNNRKAPNSCLILAAGRGSRLSEEGAPKPLLSILGLPLIERTILSAKQAGLNDFYVVVGHKAKELKAFLSDLSLRAKLNITPIYNDEWENTGNGVSVLKAAEYLKKNFILLMADHIFDESTLMDLMSVPVVKDGIVLATDYNIRDNRWINIKDVTKVSVKDCSIIDIGKAIKEYNGYDAGMFLCTTGIFHAVRKSVKSGDTSLSGGVRVLACKGRAKVFDISGRSWIDIDTPDDQRRARKLLYGTLAKPHDGWISRKINRKLSTRIFTPILLRLSTKITPNIISLVSSAVGLVAGLFFFFRLPVVGGILIQIASILDGSDGEVARLKKLQSSFGNFFDAVLDRYADSFILFGMFYYSLASPDIHQMLGSLRSPIVWLISAMAVVGNVMVSYTSAKSVADFKYRYRGRFIAAGRGRDLRLFVLFLGGLLAFIHPLSVLIALTIVATLSNTIVLIRILLSRRYSLRGDSLLKGGIKGVIFDFDGTLADTMTFLTFLATELLAENYNIAKEEAERRYLETTGLDFSSQIELMFPKDPRNQEIIDIFEAKKRENVLDQPLFSDSLSTLQFLKDKRISRFICSSTIKEITFEYCRLNGMENLVDECFGLKPKFDKGKQIDYIFESYGLGPEEVLFVGDSLKDGELAKKKNMSFVGISRIFKETEFQKKGMLAVSDLTALTRLWEESEKYINLLG